MESIPAGRDSSSSPSSKQELSYPSSNHLKPNQVSETVLYGIPIVSLVIDGQPDVVIQGNGISLEHHSQSRVSPRTPVTVTVTFREVRWFLFLQLLPYSREP